MLEGKGEYCGCMYNVHYIVLLLQSLSPIHILPLLLLLPEPYPYPTTSPIPT